MDIKKIVTPALAALILLCLCFAVFAEAEPAASEETSAETCKLSIEDDICFFVYAGTRDTVPNRLPKGTEFSFNIVFDPGASSEKVDVYANGTEIPLTDGKYTYTINEDTVFEVITDGRRSSYSSGSKLGIGEIMLIVCGVAVVAVVVWTVIANKKEQAKAGNKRK